MGNNEISGLVVSLALAKWLKKKNKKYSYRILFIPETIGVIGYLKKIKISSKKFNCRFYRCMRWR